MPELLGSADEDVIVTVGAVVSTVHEYEAAALVLPATSVASAWKVCKPSATPL